MNTPILLKLVKKRMVSPMSRVKVLKAMRLLKVMKVMKVMTQKMVNQLMLTTVMPMMEKLMMKLLKANQVALAKMTLKMNLFLVKKLVNPAM